MGETRIPDAEFVGVKQALAAVTGWRQSGMTLFGLHQVAAALADEVERLRVIAHRANSRAYLDRVEITDLRAALPAIIGCAAGKGLTCTQDDYGWAPCCLALRKARECGVAPQVERQDEADGA